MIQAIGLTSSPRKELPPAVDNVSFEARAGRVTVLLGAPGAGKTTTLRLMLELQQGRGITYFRGRPLHRIAHPSREVGVLLGDVPGHPARTVRGHLRMLCAAAGVPVRRADEVLETVGLVSLRDERLGMLSRGMDRRLGLACALLTDPHTLVLDHPADGLSVRESRWLHGTLRAHATQGGTVLLATADPKEAARTADRVVTLEQGRLVADQEVTDFSRTRLRPRVAVRSPHAARLAALLTKQARTSRLSVEVVQEGGNRLSVYGTTCAHVGETAFRHGILVHQLANEVGDMGAGAGADAEGSGHLRPATEADGCDGLSAAMGADGLYDEAPVAEVDRSDHLGLAVGADDRPCPAMEADGSDAPYADTGADGSDHLCPAMEANGSDAPHAAMEANGPEHLRPATGAHGSDHRRPAAAAHPSPAAAMDGFAEPQPTKERPTASGGEWSAPSVHQTPTEQCQALTAEPRPVRLGGISSAPLCADEERIPESAAQQSAAPAVTDDLIQAAVCTPHRTPVGDTTDVAATVPLPEATSSTDEGDVRNSHPLARADTGTHGGLTYPAPATRPRASTTHPPEPPGQHPTPHALRPPTARTLDALPPLPPPISVRPAPSPLRPLRYELRRIAGISTAFLTAAAVLVTSALTAVLLARVGHTPQSRLLAAWPKELPLPPAALGAGLLGALAFGDEFRHPALAADRGTVPRRLGLLAAKLLVAGATALLLASLTVGCDAEVLYLVYGRELAQVPADWLPLGAGWIGLVVGCAWAGVLAAGVFRSTTAGLAAVLAVPVVVVPLVQKVWVGPSVRTAAGVPMRLREVFLLQWPFGGERYLSAVAKVVAQPVGGALTLSLTTLLCAYLLTTLRSRVR